MAIFSGLFNSVNGDRKYNATWFARYFATFIGNGVFPNPSTGLQVLENENMTTTVKPGDGWINGYFIVNDSDHVLTHANADGVLNRIDRVVMQLDYSGRIINILVKKGIFASTPVAPTIQRDADYYELVLADVFIKAGSTVITQANITDQRLNTALCGIVHGVVDQVDTTTIFNQYQAWFEEMKIVSGTEFEAWFETLQDILDGNVASNLLNMINTHIADDTKHLTTGERDKWTDTSEVVEALKVVKSNKDLEGSFTTVKTYRKQDNTLYQESVLSGGIAPNYTTRTIKTYRKDGTTLKRTDVYTLSYDTDGTLLSEV